MTAIRTPRRTCIQCHGGEGGADDMAEAHEGVVVDPTETKERRQAVRRLPHRHRGRAGQEPALRFARLRHDRRPAAGRCARVARGLGKGQGQPLQLVPHDLRPVPRQPADQRGRRPDQRASVQGHPGLHPDLHRLPRLTVNAEYTGQNEGIPADVHWTKGGMACFKCHTGDALHGMTGNGRAERRPNATTASRHRRAWTATRTRSPGKSEIQQHNVHGEKLACQVCHSVENKSCYSCHVQTNDEGTPFFKIEPSVMAFKIGLNPKKSEERPWNYVVLRHAPIDPDNFAFYGKDILANFDALPTWKYATPHNIQRMTPQNKTCDSCHGNAELFLSEKDLQPYEVEANKGVIPATLPPKMGQ